MTSSQRPSSAPATKSLARQPARSDAPADAKAGDRESAPAADTQPGSPVAPVMKQFQKTEAETGGNRK